MKKTLLSLSLLALIGGAAISFQSCNKIKDELSKQIDPFNFSQQSFTITIPATNAGSIEGHETETINIQQIIDDNIPDGLSLSFNDVESIKLKKITITPAANSGFDGENNFTNFSGLSFIANTNKGVAEGLSPQGMFVNINEGASREMEPIVLDWTTNSQPPANLKDYFYPSDNTETEYYINATMRKSTNHDIIVNVVVEYEVKP